MIDRFFPPGLVRRSVRASVWTGLLAALFAAVYAGPEAAGRYLLFLGWMLANLVLWSAGLAELLGRKRFLLLAPLVAAKVVWLAVLFLLCLMMGLRPMRNFLPFLLGINTPFLILFLKAVGGSLTRSPQNP